MTHRIVAVLTVTGLLGLAIGGAAPGRPAAQEVTPADASSVTAPGLVRGWGSNSSSQLGVDGAGCGGSPVVCGSPFSGIPTFGVVQVAAGSRHTVILRADGTVWAVGDNTSGQLGNGGILDRASTPWRVTREFGAAFTDVVQVAANPEGGLALDASGHVWEWGLNPGITSSFAVQVPGLEDVVAVAAGGDPTQPTTAHDLALLADETVVAWGSDDSGQLGDGALGSDTDEPVAVEGLTGVTAVAAGARHSLALLDDGTVRAWGNNEYGQLGDGTTANRDAPVAVDDLTGITAIAAGSIDPAGGVTGTDSHSVARRDDGTVWAWGANWAGQLGTGTTDTTANPTPAQATSLTTASTVAAGGGHTLAVLADGSVQSWGSNATGQLGDGTTTPRSTPGAVTVATPAVAVGQVTAGPIDSLAVVPFASLGEGMAVNPARILDTRPGFTTIDGQFQGVGAVGPGQSINVTVVGRGGVPATGVSAVVLNATVTEPTYASFLTVWPRGFTRPVVSNLNYVPGLTVPNLVTVGVGQNGQVSVYNNLGSAHVVFDVVGYYSSVSGPDGARVHMITPARLMDTRPGWATIDGQFQGSGPIGVDATRNLTVTGRGGVPASGVFGVVLNVTVTNPTVSSYLTVFPGDSGRPNASNLNYTPGQTVPNLVVTRVPADGVVKLYNHFGTADVIVDVMGYFDNDESTETGRVIPLVPGRLFDTRPSNPFRPNATLRWPMSQFDAGITNSQASGYIVNTTVTDPTGFGYITVYPGDSARPNASNLNYVAGQTVPNLVMTKVGGGDECTIDFYNSPFAWTHLLTDVFGVVTNDLRTAPVLCSIPPVFVGSADGGGGDPADTAASAAAWFGG